MRRVAVVAACLGSLLGVAAAAWLLLRPPPRAPGPPPAPVVAGRTAGRRRVRPPSPAPAPLPPPAPVPEVGEGPGAKAPAPVAGEEEDADEDEEDVKDPKTEIPAWKKYPTGASGPVVVGAVSKYGDPDPECFVALESVEDPAREDPSRVETLSRGRFRLTGFPPGRYRVRVKGDEGPAAYSPVLEVVDGMVGDAGTLRLRAPGCIAGVLRDSEGWETGGEVRLFGRDPSSLAARVVESAACLKRQGFQLAPHESGEFRLGASGAAGWIVHRGKTDPDGIAWADLKLRPWATLDADLGPAAAGAPGTRGPRVTLTPVEVPDLGVAPAPRSLTPPCRFDRLLPGKYRLEGRWEEGAGEAWAARTSGKVVDVREGAAERVAIDR